MAGTHQMFRHVLGASFPRPVLVRIHQAAGGNAFYALEIAREVGLRGSPPLDARCPSPATTANWRCYGCAGCPAGHGTCWPPWPRCPVPRRVTWTSKRWLPAERAGIAAVRPDGLVEFSHPLFGSALYSSLPEAARRKLHRDLAGRAASPEERARHLALAADGPDRRTAQVLDEAAGAAGARGAADVAVELKELACRLTPAAIRQPWSGGNSSWPSAATSRVTRPAPGRSWNAR